VVGRVLSNDSFDNISQAAMVRARTHCQSSLVAWSGPRRPEKIPPNTVGGKNKGGHWQGYQTDRFTTQINCHCERSEAIFPLYSPNCPD